MAAVIARRAAPLTLPARNDGRDLADVPGSPHSASQPFLRHPQPHMISQMTSGLHPAITADHRRRDRDRLAEHHPVPGPDRPRPGRQRHPASVSPGPSGQGRQVRDPDSDHARPPQQLQPGLPARLAALAGRRPGYARLTGEAPWPIRMSNRTLSTREFRHALTPDTPPLQDRYQPPAPSPAITPSHRNLVPSTTTSPNKLSLNGIGGEVAEALRGRGPRIWPSINLRL